MSYFHFIRIVVLTGRSSTDSLVSNLNHWLYQPVRDLFNQYSFWLPNVGSRFRGEIEHHLRSEHEARGLYTYTLYILYSMALVEIAVHLSGDDAW